MAIYRLMRERNFDPVLRNAIAVAFECALVELNVEDREGAQAEIIANTVLEIVETGENDAFRLRRRLIEELKDPGARLLEWASATALAASEQEQENEPNASHPKEEGQ